MLLRNIAPQFGLFNGSTCYFEGLLYISDDMEINITQHDFKRIKIKDNKIEQPFDLIARGYSANSRSHQLPTDSILVSVDGKKVSSTADIQAEITDKPNFLCRFRLPNAPPTLPDFIVLRCDQYQARGGPNTLGFPGAENLVPIALTKVRREQLRKGSKPSTEQKLTGYRIGFKVECAIVLTPFKEQGSNDERLKMEIKLQAGIPGLWTVGNTRVKHPKHNYIPANEWPNALDIQVQRLNYFVIEAELFEKTIQIQASKTLRTRSVNHSCSYGESWTKVECDLANLIVMACKNKITKSVNNIKSWIEREHKIEINIHFLQTVINKIDATHEIQHKQVTPYLNETEYQRLVDYQKPTKTNNKKCSIQKTNRNY